MACRILTFEVLLLVLAVTLVVAVDARILTPNRPAVGFEKSGNYFPKMLLWHAIRTSPGRYWAAYFFFAIPLLLCFCFSSIPGMFNKLEQPDNENQTQALAQKYFLTLQNALMALVFVLIAAVIRTLADVTVTYLIGLCGVQISVETTRFLVRERSGSSGTGSRGTGYHSTFTVLISLALTSSFAVGLKDSYRPLDKLNAAYFVVSCLIASFSAFAYALPTNIVKEGLRSSWKSIWDSLKNHIYDDKPTAVNEVFTLLLFIVHLPTMIIARGLSFVLSEHEMELDHELKLIMGSTASLLQLVFCIIAFCVAQQVEGVPQTVTKAFFWSTVVIWVVSSIRSILTYMRGTHASSEQNLELKEISSKPDADHSQWLMPHPYVQSDAPVHGTDVSSEQDRHLEAPNSANEINSTLTEGCWQQSRKTFYFITRSISRSRSCPTGSIQRLLGTPTTR